MFVVQQSGAAYKLSGHEFILAMTTVLDGHGGISSIVYTPPVAPSLTGTMVITLADQSTVSVSVQNGKGVVSIAKTGTSGLIDTYTITYNDSTTSTFTVTNGAKGDTGDAWYVWIRYSGSQPTQDSDMGTTPDNWMGIYSGTSSTAPVHYTSYQWFEIKGEKGDTGNPATITDTAVEYQVSTSGTVVPSGTWTTTVPTVTQGDFLWTRTTLEFNSGSPIVSYAVAYQALDGQGAPSSATPLMDAGSGSAGIGTSFSRDDHVHPTDTSRAAQSDMTTAQSNISALQTATANKCLYLTSVACSATTGDFATVSNSAITANHVVAECVFANPSAITTDVAWTTSSGSLVLNGTCSTATTANIVLIKKDN